MCGPSCGHPAGNAAISAAAFSILTILFAISSMSSPQYAIASVSYSGSASASAYAYYLTGIGGLSVSSGAGGLQSTSVTTITPYSKFAAATSDPTAKALYTKADSAGSAAIVFYAFAIVALLLHTVSTIMYACNIRAKSPAQPCPAQFTMATFGISFAVVGFVCYLIAAALTWGVFGDLVSKYTQSFYIVTSPGAGLAGTGLVYVIVALSCELGSKLCCKDWKPPTPSVFNQQAPTTVIVTNGGHGGGGVVIQQGGFTSGGPMAVSIPAPAYAVGAPQMMAQPAPMDANQWRVQQNGKDTC